MIQGIAVVLVSIRAIVFFHGLGHYLVMKLFGLKVARFSIGFPPRLFGVKLGETDFCFGAIPAGGYVKPAGPDFIQDVREDDPEKNYYVINRPAWQRILVFFAGPLFSFILGAGILSGLFYHLEGVAEATNVIGAVAVNSPAEKAGLKRGDRILEINDYPIKTWDELVMLVSKDKPLKMKVARGKSLVEVTVVPKLAGKRYLIGIEADYTFREIKTLPSAVKEGFKSSVVFTTLQTKGLSRAASGQASKEEFGGPLAIFKSLADAFHIGWLPFLSLVAVINLILAVMNLIPVPMLDGGQMLIAFVEMVARRRLSKNVVVNLQLFSLILIIFLSIWLLQNDIERLK